MNFPGRRSRLSRGRALTWRSSTDSPKGRRVRGVRGIGQKRLESGRRKAGPREHSRPQPAPPRGRSPACSSPSAQPRPLVTSLAAPVRAKQPPSRPRRAWRCSAKAARVLELVEARPPQSPQSPPPAVRSFPRFPGELPPSLFWPSAFAGEVGVWAQYPHLPVGDIEAHSLLTD